MDWLEANSFHLCNSPGEITFQRPLKNSLQSSVLDLTWVNDAALAMGALKEWTVSPDLHTASDHLPITWTSHLLTDPSLQVPADLPIFLFDDEAAGEWTLAFLGELSGRMPLTGNLTDERDEDGAPRTASAVEPPALIDRCKKQVLDIMEAMAAASSRTLKLRAFHPRASPWYTEEVAETVAEVKKTRLSLKRSPSPSTNIEALANFRSASRKLKRVIRKAKRDWAMFFAGQVSRRDVWRLTAWYKGI